VKFVVDAQLPPRLARHLVALGHDAVHVASLPGGESQPDPDIAAYADAEDRVVVTKDADFRYSRRRQGRARALHRLGSDRVPQHATCLG
jgi:predicted nuclease of predicted toxin-antitoxin system